MFNVVDAFLALKKEIELLRSRLLTLDGSNSPKSDFLNSLHTARSSPEGTLSRVISGRVVDSQPVIGWYKVQLDGQNNFIECGLADNLSTTPVGAKKIGAIPPGTRVFVVVPQSSVTGTIIGTSFGYEVGLGDSLRDYISQASTNTIPHENLLNEDNYKEEKLYSFSPNAPIDETSLGEWGMMTETGTALFVDSFMAFLRSDENCGFWAFWHDQLARMHGHNLQIRSAACQIDSFDDEGELSVITGWSPYLWESMGSVLAGKDFVKGREVKDTQTKESQYAPTDLLNEYQVPFHRLIRFDGFLGQGFKQQLRTPPPKLAYNYAQSDPSSLVNMADPAPTPVVWEEHLAMDGNYHMVSSQGIFIAHMPVNGSFRQSKRPEDGTGDQHGKDGFNAAGFDNNNIATHNVREGLAGELPEGTGPALIADDELAYGVNWRGSHPFAYHKKDWQIGKPFTCERAATFNDLSEKHYLPKPDAEPLFVDQRYGERKSESSPKDGIVKYHPTLSFISILRDGTVVIAGPAGEEIRMGGGSIELTCPGDIQLRPGRNLVTLAGRDAIVRAVEDIDISSAEKDVRVKGERNIQVLGGNSKYGGGVLIESRGESYQQDLEAKTGSDVVFSGITLKSKSFITTTATNVYLRAGLPGSIGTITIDASKGSGYIVTNSANITSYIKDSAIQYFGEPTKIKAANYFSAVTTILASSLQVLKGNNSFGGGLIVSGNIAINEGHVFSTTAKTYKMMVPEFAAEGKKILEKEKVRLGKVDKDNNKMGEDLYKMIMTNRLYAEKNEGNDDVLKLTSFSFRTTKQCKAQKFMLFESRWAQRAEAVGENTKKWKENPVISNGEITYPYPGREAWLNDKTYKKMEKTLYPYENVELEGGNLDGFGRKPTKPDGGAYTSAEIPAIRDSVPDDNYPVIS